MKKLFSVFQILMISIFFISCGPSKETSGIWMNKEKMIGKSYESIFLVVQTTDIQARQVVETALHNKAAERGYKTVKSIEVLKPSLSESQVPTKEMIAKSAVETGCDAVFVVTLLRKEEELKYTPGTVAYSPLPYYTYSGNFFGYYNRWYPTVSTPGYYNNDKTYFIQSNLYDVKTQELMLSVQSSLFNPTSLESFSKSYVKDLVKQMEKEGLLKK